MTAREQSVDRGARVGAETWTDDGERFAVIDYNERGVAGVTREAMHMLLERAGFMQAEIPPPTEYVPGAGRERLRRAAAAFGKQGTTSAEETP